MSRGMTKNHPTCKRRSGLIPTFPTEHQQMVLKVKDLRLSGLDPWGFTRTRDHTQYLPRVSLVTLSVLQILGSWPTGQHGTATRVARVSGSPTSSLGKRWTLGFHVSHWKDGGAVGLPRAESTEQS